MTHKAPLKDSVDFSETAEAVGQTEEGLVGTGVPLVLSEAGQSYSLLDSRTPSPFHSAFRTGLGGRTEGGSVGSQVYPVLTLLYVPSACRCGGTQLRENSDCPFTQGPVQHHMLSPERWWREPSPQQLGESQGTQNWVNDPMFTQCGTFSSL